MLIGWCLVALHAWLLGHRPAAALRDQDCRHISGAALPLCSVRMAFGRL